MSSEKIQIITKETISRLLRDVKQIIKSPLTDNGIYYMHHDEDVLKGYAMIVGPASTPYFGGNYFFEISYPADYPHSPPKVLYCTNGDNIRFNPNLYKCGKVCVSLLNTWRGEQWTSCQSITTLLLTLCTLLCENPLLNEPDVKEDHPDFSSYTKIIEYKNIEIAILRILHKASGVYPLQFDVFYPIVKENFLQNKEALRSFLELKLQENPSAYVISTRMYSMNVSIDYKKLLKDFDKTCSLLHEKSNDAEKQTEKERDKEELQIKLNEK